MQKLPPLVIVYPELGRPKNKDLLKCLEKGVTRVTITPWERSRLFKEGKFSEKTVLKQCYHNALKIARTHKNVLYVEGFVIFSGIPLEHAFNYYKKEFFDTTLRDEESLAYYSVMTYKKDEIEKMERDGADPPFLLHSKRDPEC